MLEDIHSGRLLPDLMKLDFNSSILDTAEYVNVKRDGKIKERERSYIERFEN